MYVRECRNKQEFLDIVSKNTTAEVRVGERAVALPVREKGGGVVVQPALERHYVIEVRDDLQGETRVIFTEHLFAHDGKFPFDTSLLDQLQKQFGRRVILMGRISGAA